MLKLKRHFSQHSYMIQDIIYLQCLECKVAQTLL
uniref:Uncharacterized protein n=1 Tax=Podoviridae sp. ctZkC8 TaxID=2825259 RepID=A0A8S5UBE6_9CAUD|nr:MAG TPA: hypothetical protein [Podoviridae sp. ctZkC8]